MTPRRIDHMKNPSILFNLITLAIVVFGWVFIFGKRAAEIAEVKLRLSAMELKFEIDHDVLTAIKSDVQWIRENLNNK